MTVIETSRGPTRLYTATDVAEILNVSRGWVFKHRNRSGAPAAEFEVPTRGGDDKSMLLWTEQAVQSWRAYCAATAGRKDAVYSCLNAVNNGITWKLGWQMLPGGSTRWWFSTPQGWFCSENDGRNWRNTGRMRLSSDYRYFWVNQMAASAFGSTSAILRSADGLRRRIEAR